MEKRFCKECGRCINDRRFNARFCESCSAERKKLYMRKYMEERRK